MLFKAVSHRYRSYDCGYCIFTDTFFPVLHIYRAFNDFLMPYQCGFRLRGNCPQYTNQLIIHESVTHTARTVHTGDHFPVDPIAIIVSHIFFGKYAFQSFQNKYQCVIPLSYIHIFKYLWFVPHRASACCMQVWCFQIQFRTLRFNFPSPHPLFRPDYDYKPKRHHFFINNDKIQKLKSAAMDYTMMHSRATILICSIFTISYVDFSLTWNCTVQSRHAK